MAKLSININKFALIRNSRGENNPDISQLALQLLNLGADGITVHPRPDERHIKYADLPELKLIIDDFNTANNLTGTNKREFNVEGYPSKQFIELIQHTKPDQVTLVPDPPEALTSSFGWDIEKHQSFLKHTLPQFGCRTSIFLDPKPTNVEILKSIRPDRIEIYTYDYARDYISKKETSLKTIQPLINQVHELNIGINAGHDLDKTNVGYLLSNCPEIEEVSIGHAFVCDCIQEGIERTFNAYKSTVCGK